MNFQYKDQVLPNDPEKELKSAQICENLRNFLTIFGRVSTSQYDQCEDDLRLLGMSNSIMQQKQPICYSNLVQGLCKQYITMGDSNMIQIKQSIISQIIDAIEGCRKKIDDEAKYFRCPGYDIQKKRFVDGNAFCNGMETKNSRVQYYDGRNSWEILDLADQDYREYIFLDKKEVDSCIKVTNLYNYCQDTYGLLIPTQIDNCVKSSWGPYSGATLMKYNQATTDKCQNFILPFFANQTRIYDLTGQEYNKYCDNIIYEIRKSLDSKKDIYNQEKQKYLDKNIEVKKVLPVLDQIKENNDAIKITIQDGKQSWVKCYALLFSFAETSGVLNINIAKNFKSLQETVASIQTISVAMAQITLSSAFQNGLLADSKDILEKYYSKIKTQLSGLNGVCETLQNNVDQKMDTIGAEGQGLKISMEMVDKLQDKVIDSNSDFTSFILAIDSKVKDEKQKVIQELADLMKKVKIMEIKGMYLSEQKQKNSIYFD